MSRTALIVIFGLGASLVAGAIANTKGRPAGPSAGSATKPSKPVKTVATTRTAETRPSDALFLVRLANNKLCYMDIKGRIAFEAPGLLAGPFSEGLAVVSVGGKIDNSKGVLSGAKYGVIDKSGKMVIKPRFDDIGGFSEDLVPVRIGDKWGFVDKRGKIVIPPKYASAGSFSEGLAAVWIKQGDGNACGYIDKTGKFVIQPGGFSGRRFSGGLAITEVWGESQRLHGFINKRGKMVIPARFYHAFDFSEGLACVSVKAKKDMTDEKIVDAILDDKEFVDEPEPENGKFGFIDKTGKFVIEPRFGAAHSFREGLAPVLVVGDEWPGKWGYINKKGKFVIQPRFDIAWPFREGLASVSHNYRSGFINRKGSFVFRLQGGFSVRFHNGLARVDFGKGKYEYVNRTGQVVRTVKPATTAPGHSAGQ